MRKHRNQDMATPRRKRRHCVPCFRDFLFSISNTDHETNQTQILIITAIPDTYRQKIQRLVGVSILSQDNNVYVYILLSKNACKSEKNFHTMFLGDM